MAEIRNALENLGHVIEANDAWSWLIVLAAAVLAAAFMKLAARFIAGRLRRLSKYTASIWDDAFVDLFDELRASVLFAWAFYLLSKPLNPPPAASRAMLVIVVILTVFQLAVWGLHLIKAWRDNSLNLRMKDDPSSAAALGLLYTMIQGLFLVILVLIGLSNVGIDVGALVAGLGVGGIAVALAAQNILGDLLASLSIVLDRPFVVGDFIQAGNEMGTVENIGIKTTRLRSLSGEEIIVSNKDLLESRVRNHKRMWKRRAVVKFGVTYSTPPEQLEQIPKWVRGFVAKNPKLAFDRCHISGLAESSVDYELVFFVDDPDYNAYMDLQQALFLDLFRKFEAEGIEFAYPTRTIQLQSETPKGTTYQDKRDESRPSLRKFAQDLNSGYGQS